MSIKTAILVALIGTSIGLLPDVINFFSYWPRSLLHFSLYCTIIPKASLVVFFLTLLNKQK